MHESHLGTVEQSVFGQHPLERPYVPAKFSEHAPQKAEFGYHWDQN